MTKKKKTPFGIFTEAIGLYFSNFKQFVKYMSFPVWGQVIGLAIAMGCALIYSRNLPYLIEKYSAFNNFNTLVLISIAVAIPGMIIFIKAFWEYLVAYGAVNSMLDNMLKSGKVYDFSAHTELIKRRTAPFVSLWLMLSIFMLVASFPLFWVPAGVVAIYLVLVFQVFTYEPELSPVGCIKKSFELIKGHFAPTFVLMLFSAILCGVFIPQIFNYLSEVSGLTKILINATMQFTENLPLNEFNAIIVKYGFQEIKNEYLAALVITTLTAQIFIQYTLPLRSILCGLWYKELNGSVSEHTENKKSSKKRPSEKLMENSHKQHVTSKKLDKNVLRRAMEKDT